MSGEIVITSAQARALTELSEKHGPLTLRQLGGEPDGGDVFATPEGSVSGYRIAADGTVSPIAETLPGLH